MAELPSSPLSLPPKSQSDTSQPDPQPQSTPATPQPSAATPPPPAGLNPSPNVYPPPAPLPTSVPFYPSPAASGAALSIQSPVSFFRPPMPQFSPISGAVSYQNSAVTSAPGIAPPVPGLMMPYQLHIPGQPPNPAFRPFVANGYAAMPPPGLPGYTTQYTAMARPMFAPRLPGGVGILPRLLIPLIPGLRPILPPNFRPGLVPVTPAEKPQTTVYVGKVSPSVSNDVMLSLLQFCGLVKSWKRVQDPTDGTLKRFGLCEFESAEGVLRALRLLNKLNLDGQELGLKFNEATKGYLLRYIEKKTENAEKLKESETAVAEKEGEDAAATEKNESSKPGGDEMKKDDESNSSKADDSGLGKKDDVDQGKKDEDYTNFGLVTDEDREADRVAWEKISAIIEERLKSLPPPPPLTDQNPGPEVPAKSRDGDSAADVIKNDAEDKNDEETTSDNKTTSEHDKAEISSPDRNRRYDRRNRDRDRDVKGDRGREMERHEREAERERTRIEREQRRKIEDAEREYERRLKDWDTREREKEKARQREREKEKERERKRDKEIHLDEEEDEEDSRRWHRSVLEDKRKKRMREKEDDLADRIREEEENAEAKKRAKEEEKLRQLQQDRVQLDSDGAVADNDKQATMEIEMAESKDRTVQEHAHGDAGYASHTGEEGTSQIGNIDGSTLTVATGSDTQNNNAPAKKLGFGLSGSGKRTAVLSVFREDDDDDAHKDKKMRPLVPIDYSNEEMQAVQSPQAEVAPQLNLAAAAEFAKRISSAGAKDKPEMERERNRRSHDRSSHRERVRERHHEDGSRAKEKSSDRERDRQNGSEKSKAPDNKKLLDAKQLIDMIPKTKEDLFAHEINWALYDEHKLHERMRPWISKKITEFLGEEEKTLVDYIVSSTQEHVNASEMLETLENVLDEEAEMFVLKMWRMLIFEIKKVESGLHSRSRT